MIENRSAIIDALNTLHNSAHKLVASGAGTVDGEATYYDTGGGYTKGMFVVDISTLQGYSAAASCHVIEIALEGSSSAAFTTYVRLASFRIGQKAAGFAHTRLGGDSTVSSFSVGRYMKPWHNKHGETVYRYLRAYATFAGTVSNNAIKFKAYISK